MKAENNPLQVICEMPSVQPSQGHESLFDRKLGLLLSRAEYLLTHGAFHLKLHFSGEQMTCWWFNDPMRYQVFRGEEAFAEQVLDKCSDSEIMGLAITDSEVAQVLWGFRRLRHLKGKSYLRSASLNRVNGMLGISFTCDNIHYLPHYEYPAFLEKYGIAL